MQRRDRQPPVAGNRFRIVLAAETDVEPRAFADADPAAPAEEAMGQLAEADGANDLDAAHSVFRMMMSSSAWLPTMKS